MNPSKSKNHFWTLAVGGALAVRAASRWNRRVDFTDAAVLITGGGRGLGLAIARQFAREGARLALVGRNRGELERARDILAPATVEIICRDLSIEGEPESAVADTVSVLGGLDVLVNNAGEIGVGPAEHMQRSDFDSALAVHFWAPLATMNAAIPHLQASSGRIVNIASVGGRVAVPHLAPYCASKFALVGLSDGLRAELRARGIRVTTVSPGLMRTGSHVNAQFKGDHQAEYAWFASGAGIPGSSTSADAAARRIVRACRYGDANLTVGLPARLLVIADALMPNLVADGMALIARALPDAQPGITETRSGWDSQGLAPEILTRRVDREVMRHNELNGHDPAELQGRAK